MGACSARTGGFTAGGLICVGGGVFEFKAGGFTPKFGGGCVGGAISVRVGGATTVGCAVIGGKVG